MCNIFESQSVLPIPWYENLRWKITEVILFSCLSLIGINAADDSQERLFHMLCEDTDKCIIII
jgi:hypothetical protein